MTSTQHMPKRQLVATKNITSENNMSFTVAPKPSITQTPPPASASNAAKESRARALAMLSASAPQTSTTPTEAIGAAMVESPKAPEPGLDSTIEAPESKAEVVGESAEVKAESTETPPKAEESEPLSSQYAQLARKEKAIRAKAQAVQAQMDGMKAKEQLLEQQYAQKLQDAEKAWKGKLLQDPLSVMQETGLSYEQVTERLLNQPQVDPNKAVIDELRNEIKALRDAQEGAKKAVEEQQTQAYKQAISQLKSDATKLVASNPDFEMIKETGSVDDVVELIEETYKKDGVIMTVEEASKQVEDYLTEEALKLAKIKKFQSKLQALSGSASPTPKAGQSAPAQPPKQQLTGQLKTLTNSVGATRQLSARERAILAMKGELK